MLRNTRIQQQKLFITRVIQYCGILFHSLRHKNRIASTAHRTKKHFNENVAKANNKRHYIFAYTLELNLPYIIFLFTFFCWHCFVAEFFFMIIKMNGNQHRTGAEQVDCIFCLFRRQNKCTFMNVCYFQFIISVY